MIRNIWAVGRNYGEHAKELGNQVPSSGGEPLIFLKAGSTAVPNQGSFRLPHFTDDVHFEVELALRFGHDLTFDALTLAIDLTARDLQTKLKNQGHPWTLAKSFRDSCCLGDFVALSEAREKADGFDLQALEFRLKVNGETRQVGHTQDMIHTAEKLRLYVTERFPVEAGDVLLTGTPQGVGKVNPGDHLIAEISGLLEAEWRAVSASRSMP
jgi:2-keto-4-pentenoate hydratase/2-oxohepta-3-ene-1,7-dioic acid hydratase in catechol pathway